jgi:hypothetical protein
LTDDPIFEIDLLPCKHFIIPPTSDELTVNTNLRLLDSRKNDYYHDNNEMERCAGNRSARDHAKALFSSERVFLGNHRKVQKTRPHLPFSFVTLTRRDTETMANHE